MNLTIQIFDIFAFFFLLEPAYISYWERSQMYVCLTSSSVNFFTYFEGLLLRVCKLRLVLYIFLKWPYHHEVYFVWHWYSLTIFPFISACMISFPIFYFKIFFVFIFNMFILKAVNSFLFFSLTIFFFWLYYLVYLLINWLLLYLGLKLPSYSLFLFVQFSFISSFLFWINCISFSSLLAC